jgi:hypothetical protein
LTSVTVLFFFLFFLKSLFRTYCRSAAECRRVIPLCVAIWILYPLSVIEVYMDIHVTKFLYDNKVALEILQSTFNDKFVRFVQHRKHFLKHPAAAFPLSPCTYLVYMDPSLLPFGRDFLNSHIHYLESLPTSEVRPVEYWDGGKIMLSVLKNTDCSFTFQVTGTGPAEDSVQSESSSTSLESEGGNSLNASASSSSSSSSLSSSSSSSSLSSIGPVYLYHARKYHLIDRPDNQSSHPFGLVSPLPRPRLVAAGFLESLEQGPALAWKAFLSTPFSRADFKPPAEDDASSSPASYAAASPASYAAASPTSYAAGVAKQAAAGLAIDALVIPLPSSEATGLAGGKTTATATSAAAAAAAGVAGQHGAAAPAVALALEEVAEVWLTALTPRIAVPTLRHQLPRGAVEEVVKHLDHIVQNSLLRQIWGVIPLEVERTLNMFDAAYFPHVVSLLDAKDQHWGEANCSNSGVLGAL